MMMGTNLGENEAITEPRKSSNSNWSAAGAANCTSGGSQPSTHANDIPVGVNYSLMVPPNYHAATYGAPVAPQFNTYVGSSATYEPNHSLMPGNYPVPPPPPSQYYPPEGFYSVLEQENMQLRRQLYEAHAALASLRHELDIERQGNLRSDPNLMPQMPSSNSYLSHGTDAYSHLGNTSLLQLPIENESSPCNKKKYRAKIEANCSSGYRGVYCRGGRWNAQIQYAGRKMYLGVYNSQVEAAKAYDKAALHYHGDGAFTNFGTGSSLHAGESPLGKRRKTTKKNERSQAAELLWNHSISLSGSNAHDDKGQENQVNEESADEKVVSNTEEQPTRITGRMDAWERERAESLLTEIINGDRVVWQGNLAKEFHEYVNPRREKAFFEKLVSRRQLNLKLRSYLKENEFDLTNSSNASANGGKHTPLDRIERDDTKNRAETEADKEVGSIDEIVQHTTVNTDSGRNDETLDNKTSVILSNEASFSESNSQ